MSATNRGSDRLPHEQYFTPPSLAAACVAVLPPPPPHLGVSRVVEPHIGTGAYASWLARAFPGTLLLGVDIDPSSPGRHIAHSFLAMDWLDTTVDHLGGRPDVIAGNPPFSRPTDRISKKTGKPIMENVAWRHVDHALDLVADGGVVAFLLRSAFEHDGVPDEERARFWDRARPWLRDTWALAERPTFTGGGTDNCPYTWFVWQKGWRGGTAHHPAWSWKARARAIGVAA